MSEHFLKLTSEVLYGITAKVVDGVMSSHFSVLQSAVFRMEEITTTMWRSEDCIRFLKVYETESDFGNGFVAVKYRCERYGSDGSATAFRQNFTESPGRQVNLASSLNAKFIPEKDKQRAS